MAILALLAAQWLSATRALAQSSPSRSAAPSASIKSTSSSSAAATGGNPLLPVPGAQTPPNINIPIKDTAPFEENEDVLSLPSVFSRQWSLVEQVPAESMINRGYIRTRSRVRRLLSLKQAVYVALLNNPAVRAARLDPVAAQEAVNMAWAEFDPDTQASIGLTNNIIPAATPFETFAANPAFSTTEYEWNAGILKVLSSTNGLAELQFTNVYESSNSFIQTVNPYYQPMLLFTLSQPLLRNFGWKFATIGVQIAESQQKRAQWFYKQAIDDFVMKVGFDYWELVRAIENLRVAQEALKFYDDLVRQNMISLKVGTMAPIDVEEAQAAAETARANVYTAEANLEGARVTLRQDAMINPSHDFIPDNVEPTDRPNPQEKIPADDEEAIEHAVLYRPVLHQLRQSIETSQLQSKFMENQLLPQLNLTGLIGITSEQGNVICVPSFGFAAPNCVQGAPFVTAGQPGYQLPFKGGYNTALANMFNFGFYQYSVFFTWSMQLDNATAKAALSESRVNYEQRRLQYRDMLSQVVAEVQSSIVNVRADLKRVSATQAATEYARRALHDEQERFRVGMATTHDLLQYEEQLASAEGNEVQAEVDFEEAKIQLLHAQGRLLAYFNIEFEIEDPHQNVPWYARF
jgi:outer membrane protein TolC